MKKHTFNGCRLEIKLVSQSPMIHFQSSESERGLNEGFTLRASEVKPKLDKFLAEKYRHQNPGHSLMHDHKNYYMNDKHDALNYRMTFKNISMREIEKIGSDRNSGYSVFWGQPKDEEKKINGCFFETKMTIVCLTEGLRELISEWISEFFAVSNFGRMQGKGFGSFVPEGEYSKRLTDAEIAQTGKSLMEYCGASDYYYCRFESNDTEKMFRFTGLYYGIMRQGRNIRNKPYIKSFLYKYMLENNIGNEKAWMKKEGISPSVSTSNVVKEVSSSPAAYVKAFLGTFSSLRYIGGFNNFNKPFFENISVVPGEKKYSRFSSPVYFKIIGNTVFITGKRIPDDIYGRSFIFRSKNGKSGTLFTPSSDHPFDIDDFLAKYHEFWKTDNRCCKYDGYTAGVMKGEKG